MSQDSCASTCSKLSLSPDALDYMWKSLDDLTEAGTFTQIASRDGASSQSNLQFTLEDGDASLHIDKYQITRCGSVPNSQLPTDILFTPSPQTINGWITELIGMSSSSFVQHCLDDTLPPVPADPVVALPAQIPTTSLYMSSVPHTVELINSSIQSPVATQNSNMMINPVQLPSLPSNVPYPGDYNFSISMSAQSKETKAVDWTFSESLRKVFVRFAVQCPFRFSTSRAPPSGVVLRAMPIFSRPQHIQEAVRRCPHHSASGGGACGGGAAPPVDHLVHCEHKLARYDEDAYTGFHSVIIPYEHPAAGTEWTTNLYQFMCYSSCPGGLNRRPMQLVFTLESPRGQVIGRQAIEVRICACPGRDRQTEERNAATTASVGSGSSSSTERVAVTSEILTFGPAAKRQRTGDETFSITIRGRENYEILHRLRESLEVASAIPQTQFDQLKRQQENLRRTRPDVAPPPLAIPGTSVSQIPSGSFAHPSPSLPECSMTERVHGIRAGPTSTSTVPTPKNEPIGTSNGDTIVSWLSKYNLMTSVAAFHQHNLIYFTQLDKFGFDEFERLGLDDDKIEAVLIAFFRHRRSLSRTAASASTADHLSPLNGSTLDFMTPPTTSFSTTANDNSAAYEVTRYTFKRFVALPTAAKETKDHDENLPPDVK